MLSQLQRGYKKIKQRKILVVSAGNEAGGLQGLYFVTNNDKWEIVSHALIPYPPRIGNLIESCRRQAVTLADLAWLESRITRLFVECANATTATVPGALRKPHVAVLNQLTLFKGPTGDDAPLKTWNIVLGDPQFMAHSLDIPVISDFSRNSLLAGGDGSLPLTNGCFIIARRSGRKFSGPIVFVTIGSVAHMSIVDPAAGRCLLDSDTGPGMCLINRCARESNCPDGFDRDGAEAAKGMVAIACLDELATSPWFIKKPPKDASAASAELFDHMLHKPCLMSLGTSDRLATLTALTARTIYDFFRAENPEGMMPESIIVSGGGANNASLMKFLSAYFEHLPLVTSEALGVPPEMFVPLSLGLATDSLLMENGDVLTGEIGATGRITMP